MSRRKETLIITPIPSINFVYKASLLWNSIRTIINIEDFSFSICRFKTIVRKSILVQQKLGDPVEWSEENFNLNKRNF